MAADYCQAEHWLGRFGNLIRGCILDRGHEGPHRDDLGNEWGPIR